MDRSTLIGKRTGLVGVMAGWTLGLALALSAAGCLSKQAMSEDTPVMTPFRRTLEPCEIRGATAEALCGSYEVWEDRAAQSGRKLALNLVLIPARAAEPSADAFFFLHGGPGAAATSAARSMLRSLPGIHATRDMVFVDQRGTGSSNPLECDLSGASGIAGFLSSVEKVRRCRDKLSKRADLRLYTTPIAMDDLDEIRGALGYEKVNLYGGSYGSRAALVYLRRHGERVRSAVIRGVAPTGMRLPLYMPRDAQRALDIVFDECEADPACHGAYPSIRADFDRVVASLRASKTNGSDSASAGNRTPSRQMFLTTMRLFLYATRTARQIPRIVHPAANGDFEPFFDLRRTAGGVFNARLSVGMMLSVICAEDVPFFTPKEAVDAAKGSFLGPDRALDGIKGCAEWERGDIPASYLEAVRSDVPVLLISGERDPVTPPSWAEEAARFLSKRHHVLVPNMGHSGGSRCLNRMAESFIAEPGADSIDMFCAVELGLPPFTLP